MEGLSRPQVSVMMRFRPMNAEEMIRHKEQEEEQQRQQGDGKYEFSMLHDDDCIEVVERLQAHNSNYNLPLTTDMYSSTPNMRVSTKRFTFDAVLSELMTQQDVYERVGVPIVESVMKGYNGTVLAYGQTGSGKTHSMIGPNGGKANVFSVRSPLYEMRGLMPRIVEGLFDKLEVFNPLERTWRMTVSMFEIYMETIIDLLCSGTQKPEHRIREDALNGGVYVEFLEKVECYSAAEVMELVRGGMLRRHTALTNCNETSSRSHCLLCLSLDQHDLVRSDMTTMSRLYLVDLAGSEKVCKTLADGDRLKEAQRINLSLTFLGNVIHRLTDGKMGYVPYRDTKLTHILQDALGGNSLMTLLCHGTLSALAREETLSTLRFAQRAKRIRNKPHVNRYFTPQEMKMQHPFEMNQMLVLEKERLQMQNEVLEANQLISKNTLENEELERLRSLVPSLMNEMEELKKGFHANKKSLKQQCAALKKELSEVYLKHAEEKEGILTTLREIEAERNHLSKIVEELQQDDMFSKQDYSHSRTLEVDVDSMAMTESINDRDVVRDLVKDFSYHPSPDEKVIRSMTQQFSESVMKGENDTELKELQDLTILNSTKSSPLSFPQRKPQEKMKHCLERGVMTDLTGEVLQAILDGNKTMSDIDRSEKADVLSLSCYARQRAELSIVLPEVSDVVNIQVNKVIQFIGDTLLAVTRQDPVQIHREFEKRWEKYVLENSETDVSLITRDLLLITTLYVSLYAFLMNTIGNGKTRQNCIDNNNNLYQLTLKALYTLLQRQPYGAPGIRATDEAIQAFEGMWSHSFTGDTKTQKPVVFALNCSTTINEHMSALHHTTPDVMDVQTILDKTLECIAKEMDTRILQERTHRSLTSEEDDSVFCLLGSSVCALREITMNMLPVRVKGEIGSVMELIEAVIAAFCRLKAGKTPIAADTMNASAVDCLERALHTLQSCVERNDEKVAELLTESCDREMRDVLEHALREAKGKIELDMKDMNNEEVRISRSSCQCALQMGEVRGYLRMLWLLNGVMFISTLNFDDALPLDAHSVVTLQNARVAAAAAITPHFSLLSFIQPYASSVIVKTEEKMSWTTLISLGDNALTTVFSLVTRLMYKMSHQPAFLTDEERDVVAVLNRIYSLVNDNNLQEGVRSSVGNLKNVDIVACGCGSPYTRLIPMSLQVVAQSLTPSRRPRLTDLSVNVAPVRKIITMNDMKNDSLVTTRDAAVMTDNDLNFTPISLVPIKQQLYEKTVQTEDFAAKIEGYAEFFVRVRSLLERTDEITDAADLIHSISEMQRRLAHMQQVFEPTLQQESTKLHKALATLRRFMKEHPCNPQSSSEGRNMTHLSSEDILGSVASLSRDMDIAYHAMLANFGTCAQQVVDEVLVWLCAWMAIHERVTCHNREMAAHVSNLDNLLEVTRRERDNYWEDINALKNALAKLRGDNEKMRMVLEFLHVDLETCMVRVQQEQAVNASLRAEADTLKGAAADLRLTVHQVELCEMAWNELRMKMEDFRNLQKEIWRMRALHSEDLVKRKQKLLLDALRGLEKFARKTLAVLQVQQPFNTGTLESQRLTLLKDITSFTAQIHKVQKSLQTCCVKEAAALCVNTTETEWGGGLTMNLYGESGEIIEA